VEIDMEANTRQPGGYRWAVLAPRASDIRDEEPRGAVPWNLGHAVEGVPGTDAAFHRHEGSFAAGQEVAEHHPELLSERGSFASGEELRLQAHQGTFAEGQEQADPHPEVLENRGGFAAGQRKLTGIRAGQRGLPSFS
jgi:hypothetical protein